MVKLSEKYIQKFEEEWDGSLEEWRDLHEQGIRALDDEQKEKYYAGLRILENYILETEFGQTLHEIREERDEYKTRSEHLREKLQIYDRQLVKAQNRAADLEKKLEEKPKEEPTEAEVISTEPIEEIIDKSTSDVELECPICGAVVGEEDAECIECGAKFEEDDEEILDAVEENAKEAGLIIEGNALYEKGEYDKAIGCYDKVLNINPRNERAFNNKGLSLYEQEDYFRAAECFETAFKINPDFKDALENKEMAKEAGLTEANTFYNKVLEELRADLRDQIKTTAFANYKKRISNPMQVYESFMGDVLLDNLLFCLEDALEIIPKNANFTLDNWNCNGEELHKLLKRRARNLRGCAFYEKSNYYDAITYFDKAIEADPNCAGLWRNKALAANQLGWSSKVKESYKKALEIDPNYDVTSKVLEK